MRIWLGDVQVGDDCPSYFVAECGQNHNGDLNIALAMVRAAHAAGASAVKFQMRTPELAIPEDQQGVMRDTPWGRLTYLDYRRKLELSEAAYEWIDRECQRLGITWFASSWDLPSLDFLLHFAPPAIKIPSACLTNHLLLARAAASGYPVILSTGMSTAEEIDRAVDVVLDHEKAALVLMHCKSTYPAKPKILNLRAIRTLMGKYGDEAVIGYSGHEVGLWTTLDARVLGAMVLERHFTLDRSMWGTDQSASIEPGGVRKLVQQLRRFEEAEGDGQLGVDPSELETLRKLRRITTSGHDNRPL